MPTTPPRVVEGWDDDSIAAVWTRAQEKGDLKNVPAALKLQLRRASDLQTGDVDACFSIVKHTSYPAYKDSSVGWHPTSKRKEMCDPTKSYLLIRAEPSTTTTTSSIPSTFAPNLDTDILAFASFKIENDDPPHEDRPLVYIYEVHVGEGLRGRGLGKYMVWCIEAMADTNHISKTELTVFKSNEVAIKAYKKLGYSRDEASPEDRKVRGRVIMADYMIMSKHWGDASTAES